MAGLRWLRLASGLVLAVYTGSTGGTSLSANDAPLRVAGPDLMEGQYLKLSAEVEGGAGPFHYRWFKDHEPIPEAVDPDLVFTTLRVSDTGMYWVTVSNEGGSVTSTPELISVLSGEPSRLVNLSVIGSVAPDRLTVAFTLGGGVTGAPVGIMARASGPSLAQFGIADAVLDPVLQVLHQDQRIATNDDWSGDAVFSAAAAGVGAFPFPHGSKDAAVLMSLEASSYFADVMDAAGQGGTVAFELYDLSPAGSDGARLINVSTRGTTAGPAPLTAGFTIEGGAPVTVLLRGIGPSLAQFGVAGAVTNPQLTLFRGAALIASNDNWSERAPISIESAQAATGAFPLEAGSLDAALLVVLAPGSYTAQVSDPAAAGVALIELYEVQ